MGRRMRAAAVAAVVVALVAGCGSPDATEPDPTPTAAEPAATSAAPTPPVTTEPSASATPEPTAAAPESVTPPPERPLPYPDVRTIAEVPAGGPQVVATERYDIAVVCDGANSFWTDDGDARTASEGEGPGLYCEEGTVLLAVSVPGYWAHVWASVEDDVPLPLVERRRVGEPFAEEQLARLRAAGAADAVDVTMPCNEWVGSIFTIAAREYRCVDRFESIGFTGVPLDEALNAIRPPDSWGGAVRMVRTG